MHYPVKLNLGTLWSGKRRENNDVPKLELLLSNCHLKRWGLSILAWHAVNTNILYKCIKSIFTDYEQIKGIRYQIDLFCVLHAKSGSIKQMMDL